MHIEYIEQQLNLIRFSDKKDFEITKFFGVLDYLFFSKLIDVDQYAYYQSRAASFTNYPDYLMNN